MFRLMGMPVHICSQTPRYEFTLLSPKLGNYCPFCGEQMIAQEHLDNWFQSHKATPDQTMKYETIRQAGKVLAEVILENTPASADQSAAIRLVREAVMTADAAIACDGK